MNEQEKIQKLRLFLIKQTKGLFNIDINVENNNFSIRYTVDKYSTAPTTINKFLKDAISSNKKAINVDEELLNEK